MNHIYTINLSSNPITYNNIKKIKKPYLNDTYKFFTIYNIPDNVIFFLKMKGINSSCIQNTRNFFIDLYANSLIDINDLNLIKKMCPVHYTHNIIYFTEYNSAYVLYNQLRDSTYKCNSLYIKNYLI